MVQKSPTAAARRAAKADARRAGILAAAARVFRDRGVAAAGMRDIADAAELSPGNLYYYFQDKDELIYYVQASALDRLLAAAIAPDAGPASAAARLERVITAHLTCTLEDVEGATAHSEVDGLPPRLRSRLVARRDRYERAVRAIVADGVARGEFRSVDPVLATRATLGALNWTVRWFRPAGPLTAAQVAAGFADVLLQGLKA